MIVKKATKEMFMDRKIVQLFLDGKSKRKICQELKVGSRRIDKLILLSKEKGYLDGIPLPPYPEALFERKKKKKLSISECDNLLIEHKNWILDKIILGWSKVTVFEELPIKVKRSSFYRFLKRHQLEIKNLKKLRVIPEIIHEPGEVLQLDWGLLRTVKDPETGKKRKLWTFVGVLGFSRYMMVRLVWHYDVKTTLRVIDSMLREIGGVTKRVTSDNPKCFAIIASEYEPLLNPAFERFAQHYGFRIECLPPRDPQKKGRVERGVGYAERLGESYDGDPSDIESFQGHYDNKIALANERIHGTTHCKPLELFINEEVSYLKKLPALAYKNEEFSEATVRKDGYVRFSGKYYSLEESFIGKDIFIIADDDSVSLYHQGKLLEVHPRIKSNHIYKSTKKHHLKEWEQTFEDHSLYIKRAEKIGFNCKTLISAILATHEGFVDTRIIWGILSLDKEYKNDEIDSACEKALKIKMLSYRVIKKFLENNCVKKEKKEVKRENHAYVRSLSAYQQKIKDIQIEKEKNELTNNKTTA
jgi:hypothetical protein